jgi:hypothetical protein
MTTTGRAALATDQGLTISAKTVHGRVDDRGIDAWDLKAARRALDNLKELLYGPAMRELLKAQIEDSDKNLKQYLGASNGEFSQTQVIVTAAGITMAEFLPTLRAAVSAVDGSSEHLRQVAFDFLFPTHPEHYALPPYRGVVETMGGLPTRSRVMGISGAPDFVTGCADDSYPVRLLGAAEIDDGTVFTYVLQQFKDTENGMQADLRIWYPAACPPVYLDEHAEHYAIEFRNGLRLAAAANYSPAEARA